MNAQEARHIATYTPDRESLIVIKEIKKDIEKAAMNRNTSMHLNLRCYFLTREQQNVVAYNLEKEGFNFNEERMTLSW